MDSSAKRTYFKHEHKFRIIGCIRENTHFERRDVNISTEGLWRIKNTTLNLYAAGGLFGQYKITQKYLRRDWQTQPVHQISVKYFPIYCFLLKIFAYASDHVYVPDVNGLTH